MDRRMRISWIHSFCPSWWSVGMSFYGVRKTGEAAFSRHLCKKIKNNHQIDRRVSEAQPTPCNFLEVPPTLYYMLFSPPRAH